LEFPISSLTTTDTQRAEPTPPGPRILGSWADRLEIILPLLGYAIVSLLGATTSSIGIALLRGQHPKGLMLGSALPIRSDEFLTAAPIELGVLAHGKPVFPPLAHGPDLIYQTTSGGFFESILFLEGTLLRLGPWLPDAMLFAAFRALPLLLVALFLPPLLRRFGASRSLSWLGVVLTVFAPAALWWSFMPIRVLAFAVTGSYLLILARDRLQRRSWWLGILWAVVAGGAIARLGTYYVPWGLTIGISLVAATAVYLLASGPGWKIGLGTLALGASASIVLFAGTLFDNRGDLLAELSTVNPGLRRSGGQALRPGELFSAPGFPWVRWLDDPLTSNKSELSTAFTFTALWALLLWLHRRPNLPRPQVWVTGALAGFTLLWSSWAMINWGSFGKAIPVLSIVMPVRAAQTVGFISALLLCLVLSQLPAQRRWRLATLAALGCGLLTAYGVSDLHRAFPELHAPKVWISAVVVVGLVWALTRWPEHWAPTAAVAVLLGLLAVTVNPMILGLGDLRASEPAAQVRRLAQAARNNGGLVATDDPNVSALLAANGVPTLTGSQVTGPVPGKWELLDPDKIYEEQWNRGASYIRMAFAFGAPTPTISNPGNDIILITADPCRLPEQLRLSFILSAVPQTNRCLVPRSEFEWGGQVISVYKVKQPG